MKTATLAKPTTREATIKSKINKVSARKLRVRKILVPVDFSEASLVAIGYASKIATRLGAELNLIHVFEPPPPLVGMEGSPLYISDPSAAIHARQHLRNVAEVNDLPLRPEHIHVTEGRAFEEICRLARKLGIELIIIPTRGHTGLKHLALGSTAESVVRHSVCPVLVLRGHSMPRSNGKLPAALPSFGESLCQSTSRIAL